MTINLQAANDSTAISFASDANTVNGNTNVGALTGITSILVRDTGSRATGQAVTVTTIGTLSGGFTSTGVETVTIIAAIGGSTTADGISILAATAININANLTAGDAPILLNGHVVLGANVIIDAGDSDISFGGTINSPTTARTLTVNAGTDSVIFNGALGNSSALAAATVNAVIEI